MRTERCLADSWRRMHAMESVFHPRPQKIGTPYCEAQPYLAKVPRNASMAKTNSHGFPSIMSRIPPPMATANNPKTRTAKASFIAGYCMDFPAMRKQGNRANTGQ